MKTAMTTIAAVKVTAMKAEDTTRPNVMRMRNGEMTIDVAIDPTRTRVATIAIR